MIRTGKQKLSGTRPRFGTSGRVAVPLAAALTAVAMLASAVQPDDASAHWCTYPTEQEMFARADYVFSGTIVHFFHKPDRRAGAPALPVRVAVHTVFKGELPPLVDVGRGSFLDQDDEFGQATRVAARATSTSARATAMAADPSATQDLSWDLDPVYAGNDYDFGYGHYLIFASRTDDGVLSTWRCFGTRSWPEDPTAVANKPLISDVIGVGHPPDPAASWATLIPAPTATFNYTPSLSRTLQPTHTPTAMRTPRTLTTWTPLAASSWRDGTSQPEGPRTRVPSWATTSPVAATAGLDNTVDARSTSTLSTRSPTDDALVDAARPTEPSALPPDESPADAATLDYSAALATAAIFITVVALTIVTLRVARRHA